MRFNTYTINVILTLFFVIFSVHLLYQRNKLFEQLVQLRLTVWKNEIEHQNEEQASRWGRRILNDTENFIFVGGMPRSGTTLMRVMLDSHEDIRCGDETMLIPLLLNAHATATRDLTNSTLKKHAVNDAVSAFITELITKNGEMASRICNKDPYQLMHTSYLLELFPNAKFIFMIRDPRAVIHSMITRNVPVAGFNLSDPYSMIEKWESQFRHMFLQCRNVADACLMVYYERLVQKPESEAARILNFLKVPFSETVLHHEDLIGKEVIVNPKEFSASQVKQPIYLTALTAWFDFYSKDFLDYIQKFAPIMDALGYDTFVKNPDYSLFAREDFYRFHY